MINAFTSALSGLLAASKRADAAANNIANAYSAGSTNPNHARQPYTPVDTVDISNENLQGVRTETVQRNPGTVKTYDPDASFADSEGYISVPEVDLAAETVRLKVAEAAYKANAGTFEVTAEMADELNKILDQEA